MGIPVIFVGDMSDSRLSPIKDLAEIISFPDELRAETPSSRASRRMYWLREMNDRSWTGFAADIEEVKRDRVALIHDGLRTAGALPALAATA